jgi:hypothetical protein
MKKKILFVSIIAALLMVSMPFVSTLQAANSPMISTTKTTTATNTVQTPTPAIPSITSKQQATVALIKIKMSTSDPEIQALASQGIAIVASPINPECIFFSIFLTAWSGFIGTLLSRCDKGDLIACGMLISFGLAWTYLLGVYVALGCGPFPSSSTGAYTTTSSTSTSAPIASECSLCAQKTI